MQEERIETSTYVAVSSTAEIVDRLRRVFAFISVIMCAMQCTEAYGAQGSPPASTTTIIRGDGKYCGIYSLLTCLRAIGSKVDPNELWRPEYLSTDQGSSVDDLIRAARTFDAIATPFKGLGHTDLSRSEYPMLIHVRGGKGGTSTFSHWVAFLGVSDGQFRIADPPFEVEEYSAAELLSIWDGVAIAISKQPVKQNLVLHARVDRAVLFLLIGTAAMCAMLAANGLPVCSGYKRMATGCLGIVGVSCTIAVVFHAISPIGMIRNPVVVADIEARYDQEANIEISKRDLISAMEHPELNVIVDARLPGAFAKGAIPNSINIPVSSRLSARREALRLVPIEKNVIVYCQSKSCPWADEIAKFFRLNNYRSVSVYRDGYEGWRSQMQAQN